MESNAKIEFLQGLIEKTLSPIINHDYWLLEVPYYSNVGDTLIWQGELDFLRELPYMCKGMSSYYTDIPNNIGEDDIILMQGGGNFGDLYYDPQNYRMQIVEKYPNNKIIFLPQTVWFEHEENMKECAETLSKHKKLTICARDKVSYEILKKNFTNEILLVPDMAFCIDMNRWKKPNATKEALLLKRDDKELKAYLEITKLVEQGDVTICDWLPFTEECWQKTGLRRTKKYMPFMYDWYAQNIFRPYMINSGVQLIGSHKKIYSTRLHAAILSILLDKAEDLTWFDNSYGKNSSFYETWLSDVDGIRFIK